MKTSHRLPRGPGWSWRYLAGVVSARPRQSASVGRSGCQKVQPLAAPRWPRPGPVSITARPLIGRIGYQQLGPTRPPIPVVWSFAGHSTIRGAAAARDIADRAHHPSSRWCERLLTIASICRCSGRNRSIGRLPALTSPPCLLPPSVLRTCCTSRGKTRCEPARRSHLQRALMHPPPGVSPPQTAGTFDLGSVEGLAAIERHPVVITLVFPRPSADES